MLSKISKSGFRIKKRKTRQAESKDVLPPPSELTDPLRGQYKTLRRSSGYEADVSSSGGSLYLRLPNVLGASPGFNTSPMFANSFGAPSSFETPPSFGGLALDEFPPAVLHEPSSSFLPSLSTVEGSEVDAADNPYTAPTNE